LNPLSWWRITSRRTRKKITALPLRIKEITMSSVL
jgi:hypothetical protein